MIGWLGTTPADVVEAGSESIVSTVLESGLAVVPFVAPLVGLALGWRFMRRIMQVEWTAPPSSSYPGWHEGDDDE